MLTLMALVLIEVALDTRELTGHGHAPDGIYVLMLVAAMFYDYAIIKRLLMGPK